MEKERIKELFWEVLKIVFFASAFGYVEGSVAHYLRLYYFPDGFNANLSTMEHHNTLFVELGREACTMIMLFCVAAMAKGPFVRKFSVFVLAFAVWDIFYYIALYVFEKWPKTIMDWDVLFLIPAPWFAPVLSPVLISLLGVAGALLVLYSYAKAGEFNTGAWPVVLIVAGLTSYMATFFHGIHLHTFPASYHWDVFIFGTLLIAVSYAVMFIKNLRRA